VTVLDWNAAVNANPGWVQPDGVHLWGDGPRALAYLLHTSLVTLGIPRVS
jgi:hypothetical protein